MRYRAAVALGSNLGDRLAHLRSALAGLGEVGQVVGVSSLYETAPVGGPRQGPYLNAVVVIGTDHPPLNLLEALLDIETGSGRTRGERWGPRTLDMDLVTVTTVTGEAVQMDTEQLTLPHPRASDRRFVLEPLCELWPDAPLGAERADTALGAVTDQEVERLGRTWTTSSVVVSRLLVALQMIVLAAFGTVVVVTGGVGNSSVPAMVAGSLVAGGGVVLSAVAARALGPALSPLPEPRQGTGLVVSGPYRYVRHPIYSGLVVAAVGIAVAAGSTWVWAAVALVGLFFWLKSVFEESRLRISVAGYPTYQRSVRGRLLPLP